MTAKTNNTVNTVNTVAVTTSRSAQGISRTPACTQTRGRTITLTQSSTVAQNEAIEMKMKTRKTVATGRMVVAQLAVGCLERGVLAQRGAVSTQTEGRSTHTLMCLVAGDVIRDKYLQFTDRLLLYSICRDSSHTVVEKGFRILHAF